MATQNSVISYVPQPYFIEGSCNVSAHYQVDSLENIPGFFDPDLSNFMTVVPDVGVSEFGIRITGERSGAHLANIPVTVGFIGCALLTYEDDGGNPDLTTEFSEDIVCSYSPGGITTETNQMITYAHNSQDSIVTHCKQPLRGIISGGRTNLLFYGIGTMKVTTTTAMGDAYFSRSAANVAARPHVRLVLGHMFIGIDIPIIINPRTFSWTIESLSERFFARDLGARNSEGTLLRQAACEALKIGTYAIIGSEVTDVSTEILATLSANFFDMVKVNTSYPLLFNPFPAPAVAVSTLTVPQANLTARQNFFSIYGFMDDALELQVGEYRDGLDSEYRARFRIRETR